MRSLHLDIEGPETLCGLVGRLSLFSKDVITSSCGLLLESATVLVPFPLVVLGAPVPGGDCDCVMLRDVGSAERGLQSGFSVMDIGELE